MSLNRDEIEPYVTEDETLERVVIVNIDDTISLKDIDSQDSPYLPAVKIVQALTNDRHKIFFFTDRSEEHRAETRVWLNNYFGPRNKLFMRKSGDERSELEVKYNLFVEEVKDKHRVLCVFETSEDLVDFWSNTLRVPTMKIYDGGIHEEA